MSITTMIFKISETQEVKLEKWKKSIKTLYGEYGLFEYTFCPNGIGISLIVKSVLTNLTIDLSEPEIW